MSIRVEAHPHRPKVLARDLLTISTRECKPGARVKYYATLVLKDVVFAYQPSGQERVDAEGVRNVHAWARGTQVLASKVKAQPRGDDWVKVTYNPFRAKHFFRVDVMDDHLVVGPEVVSAAKVWMVNGDCYALCPVYGDR